MHAEVLAGHFGFSVTFDPWVQGYVLNGFGDLIDFQSLKNNKSKWWNKEFAMI